MTKKATEMPISPGPLELLFADMSYRLANYCLSKDKEPILQDMKEGLNMIRSFNVVFESTQKDVHGNTIWPQGKRGLYPEVFNQLEADTTNLLQLTDNLTFGLIKQACSMVFAERNQKNYAAVPSTELLHKIDPLMGSQVASKVVYYATRTIKQLRDNHAGLKFPARSDMTIANLDDLADIKIMQIDSDDGFSSEDLDHNIRDSEQNDGWGAMFNPEAKNQDIVELNPVEYEATIHWLTAYKAWYFWVDKIEGCREHIQDEIEYQKDRAREFIAQQEQLAPVQGKSRVAA